MHAVVGSELTHRHASSTTMSGTGTQPSDGQATDLKKRPILDRSLGTAAGLSKLLPTGTTLAFQTMAPSFTRGGSCEDHDVNFAFTLGLIVFLTLLSAALNFTDSIHVKDASDKDGDGDTHYGVATGKHLRLFRDHRELVRGHKVDPRELRKRKLRRQDVLHAFVSAAVFLALAFCDAGVQRCLVKKESKPWKDFFTHLPLAVGFLATFVFIVFPSTRKGIGEDGAWGGTSSGSTPPEGHANEKKKEPGKSQATTLLAAAATLSKLLPTGTTLAFQTMAPSFTNGGECAGHRVNKAFTWGLIGLLAFLCAVLSFTDSVVDPADGHTTYYGLATCRGFWFFNDYPKHLKQDSAAWDKVQKEKMIRARDFLHAIVSAAVFMTVAFCEAGVQRCLVPEESSQWREFLTLLPLAVAFLASFLFVVFPSDRKGIGEEGAAFWHVEEKKETKDQQEPKQPAPTDPKGKAESSHHQAMAAMSITRVAPSSEDHDDGVHQLDSAAV